MDHRQLVRILAVGRIVVGAGLTIAPGVVGKVWLGEGASSPSTKLAFRTMGIRDLALGVGTYHALATGEPPRTWVALSAVSDAVDAAATAIAFRHIGALKALPALAISSSAAALGAAAIDQLD